MLFNLLHATQKDLKFYEDKVWINLLHFEGKKSVIQGNSSFFLAKDGYKNPKNEFKKTVKGLLAYINTNDKTVLCKYPARTFFIAKKINSDFLIQALSECEELEDYLKIVVLDELYLDFAAESTNYIASTMGHLYLHIKGKAKQDFNKTSLGQKIEFKKGDTRSYALSYHAIVGDIDPLGYLKALSGNLSGYYALNLYEESEFLYLKQEKRNIYKLKLNINEEQKQLFRLHLFELKDINVHYSFVTNNCTDGISRILSVLDEKYEASKNKPFITPNEYIKELNSKNLIENLQIVSPEEKIEFYQQQGYNDIFKTAPSSTFATAFSSQKQVYVYFSPIYSDIKNSNYAYKELSESRLMSLKLGFDEKNIFIKNLELVHLFSINDIKDTQSFSKFLDISLKENLYKRVKGKYLDELNEDTRFNPQVEFGYGLGTYYKQLSLYAIPILSYRYDNIHNVALGVKAGFVLSFYKARIQSELNKYFDLKVNNRGYDFGVENSLSFNILKNTDFFLRYNLYSNENTSIYKRKSLNELSFGFDFKF